MYGAGKIKSVKSVKTENGPRKYYEIEFFANRTKINLPATENQKGLRKISPKKRVAETYEAMREIKSEQHSTQWKKPYIENLDKLKEGDLISVGSVIKYIFNKSIRKTISATEKKLFIDAKNIFASEVQIILKKTKEEVLEELDNFLIAEGDKIADKIISERPRLKRGRTKKK